MGTDLSPSLLAEKLNCTPQGSSASPEDEVLSLVHQRTYIVNEVSKSPWLVWVTKGTYFNTFDVDFINTLALFLISATI